jgi:hypothetical protein
MSLPRASNAPPAMLALGARVQELEQSVSTTQREDSGSRV